MRKSTLFISAALTTFVLVLLVGVVSAYKSVPDSTGATTQQDPAAVATDTSVPTAIATIASITPEQAAALAAQVIGRTDVYSVETSVLNGASAYLVTFSSGDLVYVSPQGMVLSVVNAPVVVYSAPAAPAKNNNRRSSGGGGEGGEHEGGED
jgi:hypothetical protein